MAYRFNAVNEYIEVNAALSSAYPISMSCHFKGTNALQILTFIGDKDVSNFNLWLAARGDIDDTLMALNHSHGGVSDATASSAATYSFNVWQTGGGKFEATNNRTVYLNGVGTQNTGTGPDPPSAWDRLSIGALRDSTPSWSADVSIAEVAIWTAALTDAEFAWLGKFYSPLTLTHRLKDLLYYRDLIRDVNRPYIGSMTFAVTGATVAKHSPVLLPSTPSIVTVPAAAAVSIPRNRREVRRGQPVPRAVYR